MKRLLALTTVLLLVLSICAVNVSAAIYFNEDFSENPLPELTFGSNGRGGGSNAQWSVSCGEANTAHSADDGTLHFYREANAEGNTRVDIVVFFPELDWEAGDNIIMFDMKVTTAERPITMNLYNKYFIGDNPVRDRVQSYIYAKNISTALRIDANATSNVSRGVTYTQGEWVTFAIRSRVVNDVWEFMFYSKGENETTFKASAEAPFYAPYGGDLAGSGHASANRIEFISPAGAVDFQIDNLRIFNDVSVAASQVLFNSEEVSDIADIDSAGEISVEAEVLDATAVFGEDATTVKTFLVALDENMKMVDCKIEDVTLKGGVNTIGSTMEVSDDSEAPNYFGNLEDGIVEYYIWYDMMPLGNAIGLR